MEADTGLGNAGNNIRDWNAADKDQEGSSGTRPRDQPARDNHGQQNSELGRLAQDWISLWQSELSAMAADPELHTAWQTMMGIWAGAMTAMLRGIPASPYHAGPNHERARRPTCGQLPPGR